MGQKSVSVDTVGLMRFIVSLHQTARAHGHAVRWWETGTWRAHYYTLHETPSAFLPDAALGYQMGEQMLRFWVEWYEEGVERRDLEAKLHSYARFVQTRLWANPSPILPMLLIIVATPQQEQWIHQQSHIFSTTRLVVRTTTTELLSRNGPTAPIWFPAIPEGAHCSSWEERLARRTWEEIGARKPKATTTANEEPAV